MEAKTDSIQIRCSTELKRKLKEAAAGQGITLTKDIWLAIMAQHPELAADIMAEI